MSDSTAFFKDTSFVPDLGDTGTISSLHFGQFNNDLLLASANFNTGIDLIRVAPSGNKTPNGYAAFQSQRIMQKETPAPCVTVQIDPLQNMVLGGCCDGSIQAWLPATGQMVQVGSHNDICSHLRLAPQHGNLLISSGYDGFIKYWDVRTQACQGQVGFNNRIVGMDYQGDLVVVALSDTKVATIDLRKPTQIMGTYDTKIEEVNSGVVAMHNNEGFVTSGLDSRARVEFITPNLASKSFIFRAHRIDQTNGVHDAFTFSALACHPKLNTLVTCGCDGTWVMWDFYHKQRLTVSERSPLPVTAAAFSPDGNIFAFASSYNWFRGANGDPKNANTARAPQCVSRIGFFSPNQNQLQFSGKR